MFLPIKDVDLPSDYYAVMTTLIIFVNTIIWLLQVILIFSDYGYFLGVVFYIFGSIPEMILTQKGLGAVSIVTSIFLHGGFFHLLGNMWSLWVFGRRVEIACGSWRFLLFYLFCGVTSGFIDVFINYRTSIPSIGASGAVFGVMAAYLLLFPGGRIRTLVIFFLPAWPKIRAFWIVLFFLILEIPPAADVLLNDAEYSIGHWAHIGGFFGALSIIFFLKPDNFRRYINHLPL